MNDYRHIVVSPSRWGRDTRRLGFIILAVVVLGCLLLWHLAATDPGPAVVASASSITTEQVQTMRATGRVLSMRSLVP